MLVFWLGSAAKGVVVWADRLECSCLSPLAVQYAASVHWKDLSLRWVEFQCHPQTHTWQQGRGFFSSPKPRNESNDLPFSLCEGPSSCNGFCISVPKRFRNIESPHRMSVTVLHQSKFFEYAFDFWATCKEKFDLASALIFEQYDISFGYIGCVRCQKCGSRNDVFIPWLNLIWLSLSLPFASSISWQIVANSSALY